MNYKIVTKYIKDISFKIPDAKSYFLIEKNIKDYKINFDIKSKRIKEDIIEIDTNLSLISQTANDNRIKVSILFSSLINLEEKISDKKKLEEIVLVDVPTSIYPDIRNILIFLFEKSGYKNINIDQNINFKDLHKKNT
tara:strand:+ start:222 stop:635 length:414 start_codon:yes stop_codon:yes gene_type:complete